MASAFREIFGDMLLTEALDPNATQLPSPNRLKRKIILKVCEFVLVFYNTEIVICTVPQCDTK